MNKEQKLQLENEVSAAAMGRQVLNNKAFKDAFAIRRAQIFDTFCKTSKDQEDIREEAWRTMKNLDALEDYFRQLLETGKLAEQTLEQLTKSE